MMPNTDERILILTSTQKDSQSTQKILLESGLNPDICENLEQLLEKFKVGAGALLLAKEVLGDTNLGRLTAVLHQQESWSDLPIIILASGGDLIQGKAETIRVLKTLRNATMLERPVRVATLISILETAIANRKRQYEVRRLVQDLVEARKEAETAKEESDRANRAKSDFLANMSHEIRTPLGVILGFTDVVMDEKTTAAERKAGQLTIHRNGQLLLALVNDVLDLAKVEAGRIDIDNVQVSIEEILQEVTSALQPVAHEKNVKIVSEIDRPFPHVSITDPTRVRQIFLNVLGNAVKFTKSGSVSLQLSSENLPNDRCRICLSVQDTGLGITDQQKEKLFKPFSQADSSTTREFGGTGLGLVLSRQLARALGGDLRLVYSKPGVGSKFEISLEVGCFAGENVDAPTKMGQQKFAAVQGMRILLVDDSLDNQTLITHLLKMVGAVVNTARDGIEGIEKALKDSFDVVLMDIQMPRLDGWEATKRLRDQGYQKPIIALTANALAGDREKAMTAGFDGYITKPIQKNKLYESVSHYFKK